MKGKRGRPSKRKPIEKIPHPLPAKMVEEMLSEEPEGVTETIATGLIPPTIDKCDCGKPVHPGTPQCWDCSHRA